MLTTDSALTSTPAISRDAKLVAYSSDINNNGHLDLYVKQIPGGHPLRLTFDGLGNTKPDFSPDGSKIVFRSDRDEGGIYVIPSLGGEVNRIAAGGFDPKFSPDGSLVTYWAGNPGLLPTIPGSGTIWVVPVSGGQPRQLASGIAAARFPIWFPDGTKILFVGTNGSGVADFSSLDWWVAAADGSGVRRSGAFDAIFHSRHDLFPPLVVGIRGQLGCWRDANTLVFPAKYGSRGLWTARFSNTGSAEGAMNPVTTGSGDEQEPSCAQEGSVAFTKMSDQHQIWSLPLDPDHPQPGRNLQQLTQGTPLRDYISLSRDGKRLAFSSDQAGTLNIWMRDTETGRESQLNDSRDIQRFPALAPSGTKVAWSVYERDKRAIYTGAPGVPAERLCDDCLRATDWTADEKGLLIFAGKPYRIELLDIATHRRTPVLQHPSHDLLQGHFSPDHRWIAFNERLGGESARIVIAPFDGVTPARENTWIPISDATILDWANWSPDGKTIYFSSHRDGFACFWAQRLDERTHRPVGEPVAVLHLHGRLAYKNQGWSLGGAQLAAVLEESTDNIGLIPGDK